MTLINYVSVRQYESGPKEGDAHLVLKKGQATGSDIFMPSPDNDVGVMDSGDWERTLVFELPEKMAKDDAREWLEQEKPDEVWDALEGQ